MACSLPTHYLTILDVRCEGSFPHHRSVRFSLGLTGEVISFDIFAPHRKSVLTQARGATGPSARIIGSQTITASIRVTVNYLALQTETGSVSLPTSAIISQSGRNENWLVRCPSFFSESEAPWYVTNLENAGSLSCGVWGNTSCGWT